MIHATCANRWWLLPTQLPSMPPAMRVPLTLLQTMLTPALLARRHDSRRD